MSTSPIRLLLIIFVWSISSCSSPDAVFVQPSFLSYAENELFIDINEVNLLVEESGNPVSTKIVEDESLGTVHTFDLFPVIVSEPVHDDSDGLWRIDVWVSSGRSITDNGYTVSVILGYDDTVIEYDLLPGYVFAYKSGSTEKIANVVSDLKPGDQIYLHVIGEHSFTDEDLAALAEIGFDYAQLVVDHEAENITLLEALARGTQPAVAEIRGVGAIYRGISE